VREIEREREILLQSLSVDLLSHYSLVASQEWEHNTVSESKSKKVANKWTRTLEVTRC
jgi:hypothetical protein